MASEVYLLLEMVETAYGEFFSDESVVAVSDRREVVEAMMEARRQSEQVRRNGNDAVKWLHKYRIEEAPFIGQEG